MNRECPRDARGLRCATWYPSPVQRSEMVDGCRTAGWWTRLHPPGKEGPRTGTPLSSCSPEVRTGVPSRTQVLDRGRREHFPALRCRPIRPRGSRPCRRCRRRNRAPPHRRGGSSDLDAELFHSVHDDLRAAEGASRAVESGQEPSPIVLISRPRCSSSVMRTKALCSARTPRHSWSPSSALRLVDETMSVNSTWQGRGPVPPRAVPGQELPDRRRHIRPRCRPRQVIVAVDAPSGRPVRPRRSRGPARRRSSRLGGVRPAAALGRSEDRSHVDGPHEVPQDRPCEGWRSPARGSPSTAHERAGSWSPGDSQDDLPVAPAPAPGS